MPTHTITLTIVPGAAGEPPMVRADGNIQADSDAALVARCMLSSAAYLFTQGQPVKFGPEVPLEVLR